MQRNLVIFIATFSVGALIALAARAAWHEPHGAATAHTVAAPASMVGNALTPATKTAVGAGAEHAGHEAAGGTPVAGVTVSEEPPVAAAAHAPATAGAQPVNTRCAICGMAVDPTLPTLEYQGKTIGFGCKMCAPKFKADPDKYGPSYLRNEVIKR